MSQGILKRFRLPGFHMISTMDIVKRILVIAISIMMGIVLFLAVVDLGYVLILDIISPPYFVLDIGELLEIFGLFLLVLIGIELFETMEIYIKENVVHTEVVFAVALIAVARKVIILEVKNVEPLLLVGIGAVIFALSLGYYLILKARKPLPGAEPGK
jgi:uncharacterized membrane protein (DUF373 family)